MSHINKPDKIFHQHRPGLIDIPGTVKVKEVQRKFKMRGKQLEPRYHQEAQDILQKMEQECAVTYHQMGTENHN